MKFLKFFSVVILFWTIVLPTSSQENAYGPQRTPEQEAAKQTEKLQQELNLSPEQSKQVYNINLRYARERQISNKRTEAVERMKNKNADIQNVLSEEQNNRLQSKRYEHSSTELQYLNRNRPVNPAFRSSTYYRSNHVDLNQRNANRPVNANFQNRSQRNQTTTRSSSIYYRPVQNQRNPAFNGSSTNVSPNAQRRQPATIHQDNSSSVLQRSQSAPTRREDSNINSNRR